MKTRNLLFCWLSIFCAAGPLFASSFTNSPSPDEVRILPVEDNEDEERIPIGDRALPLEEERAFLTERYTRWEVEKEGQSEEEQEAIATAPIADVILASAKLQNQAVEDLLATTQMSTAPTHVSSHPGIFKYAEAIYGYTVLFEDGSKWRVHPSDIYLTWGWKTAETSFFPHAIVIALNLDYYSYLSYRFCLVNQSTNEVVRAELDASPLKSKRRYIYSYAWLSDSYGNLYVQLCLNDGSIWNMLSSDFPFTGVWQPNDTVIIGGNNGSASGIAPNILININTNTYGAGLCVFVP